MMRSNHPWHRRLAWWAGGSLAAVGSLSAAAWAAVRDAPWLLWIAVTTVVSVAGGWAAARRRDEEPETKVYPPPVDENPDPLPAPACGRSGAAPPGDPDALVAQMVAQSRYALLLRPKVAKGLSAEQFRLAREELETHMALVPEGTVTLGRIDEGPDDFFPEEEAPAEASRQVVHVNAFFLDRHPVTNRQYFEFVAAGGYQQAAFWDPAILPAMLDFVDRTGQPGPRYWKNGCYLRGQENHPVVGVCWHEAAAYARWVGKRLPTNAEWTKAGSWPVPMSDTKRFQRKFPWGDAMDRGKANLWGSGPEQVIPVDALPEGVSVGGVYQLVGNVWEWTSGPYDGTCHPMGDLTFDTPMKSLRGGAYDTYFDNQATCQFLSGDAALARRRNIGFRVALGACDLALAQPGRADAEPAEEEVAAV
ncbi:MAG: SUMF1/EgtB/PvdO family nonheme iron enzyme [Pirellulales bacterium]|nr:SUMF1/EgtB/PvdO family nonheme iron enzyme [Pirellulales bacterium]